MTNEVETPYLPNPRIMTKTLKNKKSNTNNKDPILIKKKRCSTKIL